MRNAGLAGLGAVAWAACGGSDDPELTTLDGTLQISDDGTLVTGPGEQYAVRTELAGAQAGRAERRQSLAVFHHFTDFRICDEESPAREEWRDECPTPVVDSFRRQETLSVQAADALIQRANAITKSPVTGTPVQFALHTGNAVDNAQFNEMRWFIDLLDGKPVYPDSGAIGYQGVQSDSPAADYGDLLRSAQLPFSPLGLRVPWYAVAGNRDVLVQGDAAPGERSGRIARGAQKIVELGPAALAEACAGQQDILGSDSSPTILNDPDTVVRGVGADGNRRFLSRVEWVAEHFATGDAPGPAGHGFTEANLTANTAYYVVQNGPVVLIVIDTVNPSGLDGGSIDEAQFLWLEQRLIEQSSLYIDATGAQIGTPNPDRLVIVASHHPISALNNPFPGPNAEERRYQGPELEDMLHRFPNVVLHIAGHTLEHRIIPRPFVGDPTRGYWEVTTGGSLDTPMQARLIEVVDNLDGTVSIFSTVYDNAAPLNPGDADDPSDGDGLNQLLLAGVARQLAARDPQRSRTATGLAASDRNAELIVPSVSPSSATPTPIITDTPAPAATDTAPAS